MFGAVATKSSSWWRRKRQPGALGVRLRFNRGSGELREYDYASIEAPGSLGTYEHASIEAPGSFGVCDDASIGAPGSFGVCGCAAFEAPRGFGMCGCAAFEAPGGFGTRPCEVERAPWDSGVTRETATHLAKVIGSLSAVRISSNHVRFAIEIPMKLSQASKASSGRVQHRANRIASASDSAECHVVTTTGPESPCPT